MPLAAVGKIVSEEWQTWMSGYMKHGNELEENRLQQSGRIMQWVSEYEAEMRDGREIWSKSAICGV